MPPEVSDILLLALFNPATLIAGYWLGRRADQTAKVLVAGFMAGLAGAFFAWTMMKLGFTADKPRLVTGILIAAIVAGTGWAALGHWTRRHRDDSR